MTSPVLHIEILILAAGASSRMRGTDKLLESVLGRPLIAHVASRALATGCPVSVTLDASRPLRSAALAGLPVRQIVVPDPGRGMTASLQAGLAALPATAAVMVLLGDMPDLTTPDLETLLELAKAHPDLILRACATGGLPGHPVLFPPWVRPEIDALQGDPGPREVLRRHKDRLRMIPLPGLRAITDLDTPEDWAAWRAQHS
jgi:CTP:molybdopterin cytidylyltransferase MocA